MEKELLKFIIENNLSPFNKNKTKLYDKETIYRTKDAKQIFHKLSGIISSNFIFSDTSCLLEVFSPTQNKEQLLLRQNFLSSLDQNLKNDFLAGLNIPRAIWKPKYDIVAVTENEQTFAELKKTGVSVKFLTSEEDVRNLENYDIVQVVDCDNLNSYLEQLNQTVFIKDIEDVYLERYLEMLSGWISNLELLEIHSKNKEILAIIDSLRPLFKIMSESENKKLSRNEVEFALEEINNALSEKLKSISISGNALFEMLTKNSLSSDILKMITEEIEKTGLSEEIFLASIPVSIDEKELNHLLKLQDSNYYVSLSEKLKLHSSILKQVPEKLARLEDLLLIADFYAGLSYFMKNTETFPIFSDTLSIDKSKNLFLENAQPISFLLNPANKCSILTGANSGGKTTLLEHILQLLSLSQMGFPVSGKVSLPIFSDIYYFAKNKGSANKGAFETLLTQMSKISAGSSTLILADEIESVTEPGVAGKILCATSDYFIKKGCFIVIATHLGYEIKAHLPEFSRIDGIEAKGLDDNYELIVDHNPVLGRLAHSTPELIVEKMANSPKTKSDYLVYLFNWMKK